MPVRCKNYASGGFRKTRKNKRKFSDNNYQ